MSPSHTKYAKGIKERNIKIFFLACVDKTYANANHGKNIYKEACKKNRKEFGILTISVGVNILKGICMIMLTSGNTMKEAINTAFMTGMIFSEYSLVVPVEKSGKMDNLFQLLASSFISSNFKDV